MNEDQFKQAIIEHFGTWCKKDTDKILDRFSMTIAAMKFAGNQGDNPLCKLNRVFEQEETKLITTPAQRKKAWDIVS